MITAEFQALQRTVSELMDLKAVFLSRFEDAVISALPSPEKAIVESAIEREVDCEYKSPVLAVIRRHAFPSRVSVLQDDFLAWTHEVIDDAVRTASYEVRALVADGLSNRGAKQPENV
jgi:hypothetical protein